jgi:cytochrome c oxidase subunit 3
LRRARLGLAVGLTPIIMLFVSFTSAYVFRKGLQVIDDHTQQYVRDWLPIHLPWTLLMINTAVLVVSSGTMELARRALIREMALAPVRSIPGVSLGEERRIPWLGFTIVLGMSFLAGQFLAWRQLADRGFFMSTTPSSSFVYLLTGMHAIHLAGGVLALAYAGTTAMLRRPLETRRIVVDITAWYWHFMALLWLYIFALLAIAR